jgi:Xaa-Pro aminopeptidase
VPRQNLSERVLQKGDVINMEVSISHWGYSGQVQRPVFVGQEPNALYRRLWDCALDAYTRGVQALKAGATTEDLLDASDVIATHGFTINDGFLHGFGIGLLPPNVGTRQSTHRGPQPPKEAFEAGMCVVLQPNVVTHDERAGVQLGNLLHVTASGVETLHKLPVQYFVSG